MPRRGNIAKRDVLADPIYNSKMVTRLVNSVMLDGKKGVAQKIVYEAFSMIQEKTGNDPLETFEKAMENIMPSLECKTRRVGGANYQVPLEVSPARRETLGLRWLTAYSRSRGEKTMAQRLAAEIMIRVKLRNEKYMLKPGMFTNVYVQSAVKGESMPCVNAHAVIFEDGKEYVVYVSKEGYLQMREISVYKQTEKFCYLRSGLKDGDRIVDRNALLVYNELK